MCRINASPLQTGINRCIARRPFVINRTIRIHHSSALCCNLNIKYTAAITQSYICSKFHVENPQIPQ
ncbi:hypothetical protein BLAT2472_20211 [Burkholderia latens]